MEWWQDVAFSPLDWYRSWPEEAPEGRAYVQDSIPRLTMRDCDYFTLDWPDPSPGPGICLLEWDIALDRRERAIFASEAMQEPDRVLVAPYYKFYGSAPRLVHRQNFEGGPTPYGAPETELFGFGCIYLPTSLLREFLVDSRLYSEFSDTTFSRWHRRRHGLARLTWSVHPQHLHGD